MPSHLPPIPTVWGGTSVAERPLVGPNRLFYCLLQGLTVSPFRVGLRLATWPTVPLTAACWSLESQFVMIIADCWYLEQVTYLNSIVMPDPDDDESEGSTGSDGATEDID